ncbi:cyanoexosortase A [Tolypothrix sp. FACHB-123]|uniref:cyanoexosortase A n=1 Tax=Tolypothrix sp. FACHB-123 TaxID=2692868 RepID=UPI001681EEF1|nr:cyanoexosortase A [Tolypothrix sp. FACHB-123]MBD2358424.1 cyanoexosortase A [Tolypothrix sp. FACHB-123]
MKSPLLERSFIKRFSNLKLNQLLVLGIVSGLIAIHLSLTIHHGMSLFLWSILFSLAILFLIGQKRSQLNVSSNIFCTLLGLSLITITLVQLCLSPSYLFLGFSPLISALGLILMASGYQGLKQYKQELILLFFWQIPFFFLSYAIDITSFTVKFATYILWYFGYRVTIHGFYIVLPAGSINVYGGCSGWDTILSLLRLSVVFLILFPLAGIKKRIIVPLIFMLIGFVINGFRVALMAILTAAQNQQAFEYWHTGKGSLIFSMIGISLSSLFYYLLILRENPETKLPYLEGLDR